MDIKVVAENRKARHDYFIEETYEAGLELRGTEVKSLLAGRCNLKDSFALVKNGEAFLHNVHISPYEQGNQFNHEPTRARKLLLHKHQIHKIAGAMSQKGLTLIPLKVYFNERGRAKVLIGLAKGKKSYDKRQDLANKDAKREMERVLKDRQR